MKSIRAILVDDESRGLKVLELLSAAYKDKLEIIASCRDPEEAIQKINYLQPDLLIMDIQMPNLDAFDILSAVESKKIEVIFVTAYNNHALKAFQYSAVDYLLKPVDEELFQKAVFRAFDRIHDKQANHNFEALLYNLEKWKTGEDLKMCISDAKGFRMIKISDILYCEAESCYTLFHLNNKTSILSSRTLGEYDEILDATHFMRIHRSYIINVHHVREYQRGEGGIVVMDNGQKLEVSRRKKDEFVQRMKGASKL